MQTNVGTIDRTLRTGVGVALLYFALLSKVAFFAVPVVQVGAIIIGLVMIATAAFKLCPLYSMLGLKTCKEC